MSNQGDEDGVRTNMPSVLTKPEHLIPEMCTEKFSPIPKSVLPIVNDCVLLCVQRNTHSSQAVPSEICALM